MNVKVHVYNWHFSFEEKFFFEKKILSIFFLARSTRRGQNKDFKNFCDTTPLKIAMGNLTTDDLLELWGGVVSFTFNPFVKKTGYIITEKTTTTRWSIAPFYLSYIYRATSYGVFASEGLIKQYDLRITPIPKNVDYVKPCHATTNFVELASPSNKIPLYTFGHYFPRVMISRLLL